MDHSDPARALRALLRHTSRCPAGVMQGDKKPAPQTNPGAGVFDGLKTKTKSEEP